ncbi:MAG TPA: wax ester/triacylglycerol synthase domain-containing protein [Glycomyces sp.]|nr:wax ester/triacylglycerol synthase domain-containing protein [Glycomyces sp.]
MATLETGARAFAPRVAMDRALWNAPVSSPGTRPHVGMVLHCDGAPPSLEKVIAHVTARLPALPALRSLPAGSRWYVKAHLDLEAHLTERELQPGPDALDQAVRALIGAPLPEHGPAWQLHLLRGQTNDGFALFYRVHHSLQDGGGILHTLETLFGDDAEAPSSAAYPGFIEPTRASLGDMGIATGALLSAARRTGTWASYPAGFSGDRMQRWCAVPIDRLRNVASGHGGTANDAYLAALAHALTQAAERLPSSSAQVPFLVPANLRRPGEVAAPGNRVILASVALPGGQLTAKERLHLTPTATGVLKSARLREAMRRFTAMTPTSVMTGMLKTVSKPAHAATLASKLVLRRRLDFQGASVSRVVPVMWAPLGIPVAAMMLTYQDTATVCFTTDPAMPGLDELRDHWQAAIESRD